VEETLPALQQAHAAQGNEVVLTWPRAEGETMAVEIVRKTKDFSTEVVEELKKVTWPDWPQLKNTTLVILVFIVIVSLIIWVMDQVVKLIVGPGGLIMNLLGR
jgi:preprotein translocase SecE subunit